MRALFFYLSIVIVGLNSCNNGGEQTKTETKAGQSQIPSFTISVKPVQFKTALPDSFPFLQSFAWARKGNKILLIGGRIQGFHGRTGTNIFPAKKANGSLWVIDLSDFSFHELALDKTYPQNLQFFSSNMEFCQDGDTLYLVGGYGPATAVSTQSNHTFDRIVALSVSRTIRIVESLNTNDFSSALLASVSSPFLKVAGGELIKNNGTFYLAFGQDFEGPYNAGRTGNYTSAVRQFRLSGGVIADTSSYIDTINLHRRDLPLATVVQPGGLFYAALGGVFTKADDGFANPVYIMPSPFSVRVDTLQQMTNNYDCAIVSIYDPASTASINVLLGGIGKYQYDTIKRQWQHGDGYMLLPFVKTITQMQFQNAMMKQYIQLPPQEPELPDFIGANAVFFPHTGLLNGNVIDYSKIVADTTSIGYLYGGIRSLRPTSNEAYPTSLNKTIYEVFLNRKPVAKK